MNQSADAVQLPQVQLPQEIKNAIEHLYQRRREAERLYAEAERLKQAFLEVGGTDASVSTDVLKLAEKSLRAEKDGEWCAGQAMELQQIVDAWESGKGTPEYTHWDAADHEACVALAALRPIKDRRAEASQDYYRSLTEDARAASVQKG